MSWSVKPPTGADALNPNPASSSTAAMMEQQQRQQQQQQPSNSIITATPDTPSSATSSHPSLQLGHSPITSTTTTTTSTTTTSPTEEHPGGERQQSISSSNNSTSAAGSASASGSGSGSGSSSSAAASSASASAAEQNKERITVPSACVQCRSKHLKCDGLSPCTRCSANSFECIYVKSRRGFKGPRKNGVQGKIPAAAPGGVGVGAASSCPMVNPNAGRGPHGHVATGLATPPDHRPQTNPIDPPLLYDAGHQELASSSALDIREKCIEAFFYHFHAAHPFILPRTQFMILRNERPMECLLAAMRYVGSFYISQAPTTALGLEAERAIYHADCPKDAVRVQAMLTLTIGLDGYTFQEKALQILLDAQDLAVAIGMNKRDFAFLNSNGSHMLEESWRRTWWELYIVDGMIAGVHQKSDFRMKDMPADVLLPCEEKEYSSGFIPPSRSLEDFDDQSFDSKELAFSSFTYRIAAMRNLGRVLSSRPSPTALPDRESVLRVDNHLVAWRLHLPDNKKAFISNEGILDEMLFQAHMITEATTVVLHREHSELDSSVAKNVTSCAPHKPIIPGESYNIHAAKMVQAAQDISKLISLPVPLVKHTHFFTCVVTLGSIVHLSIWSALMPYMQDDDLKQQLRLNTGALKTLWQVWPSAGKAFGQVKGVAQEIFSAKKLAVESGYWVNFPQEDVMRVMIEDQSIMEELQLLE